MTVGSSNNIKYLKVVIISCVMAIAVLGITTWSLNDKLNELEADNPFRSVQSFPAIGSWPDNTAPLIAQGVWDYESIIEKAMNGSLFDDYFQAGQVFEQSFVAPRIDFQDEGNVYRAIVKIPYGEEIEINADVVGQTLRVSGSVKDRSSEQTDNIWRSSNYLSEFSRSFYLDDPVDLSSLQTISGDSEITVTVRKVL